MDSSGMIKIKCIDDEVLAPIELQDMATYVKECINTNQDIKLDFPSYYLRLVLGYCEKHEFQRYTLVINSPMESRKVEDYLGQYDTQFIHPFLDNFEELLTLFKLAKALKIEELYQILAASLASFFRRRSLDDVKKDLNIQSEYQPYGDDVIDQKFKQCVYEFDKVNEEA